MTIHDLPRIKEGVKKLYERKAEIHVSIPTVRSKVKLEKLPAEFKGIYPNIFQIVVKDDKQLKEYTFRYEDLMIGNVTIAELYSNNMPE